MRTKISAALILLLIALHAVVALAGFFAPYDSEEQFREEAYAPPTRIHWFDSSERFHWRPFVYRVTAREGGYVENQSAAFPICFLCRSGVGRSVHLFGVGEPAHIFLAGTDAYGRDVFSRLLFGGRVSLLSGLLGALIAVALGTLVGALAGYYGRWIDEAAMALSEVFLSVPWLYLLLVVRALLPLHIDTSVIFLMLVAVLGAVGWARPARMIRGVVLSLKRRVYVTAARGFGASDAYLIARHILPGAASIIATEIAWYVPQFMLAEVTLSFFGLGVSEPTPSWGNMLAALQRAYVLESCWWMFAPALAVMLVFAGYRQIFARYTPTTLQM